MKKQDTIFTTATAAASFRVPRRTLFSVLTLVLTLALTASDKESGDWFGTSVAVDGDTLAVGAIYESSGGKTDNGAVYVFTRSGGSWNQQAKLTASDKESGDYFGRSVAVDGDTIAVGAYNEDSTSTSSSIEYDGKGAVYLFKK